MEKATKWATVQWLHSTAGQLVLGQLLAGYPLLGTVIKTNRCWLLSCRWLSDSCWWLRECWLTNGCRLPLLVAAVDCGCWLLKDCWLLLLIAAGCCCWLLLLVAAAAGGCWLIAACWRKSLWTFSPRWWGSLAKTSFEIVVEYF